MQTLGGRDMENKKMVVIFPGENYSADCPLLYYAGFKFEVRGYEKVIISYKNMLEQDKSFEECMEDIKEYAFKQLKDFNLSEYEDIVFVSKSLGTVVAGWVEEKLCVEARHIYLTPVRETLPYIQSGKNIIAVVAGTKDKQLNADTLKDHCKLENIYLKQIDGAGHRLEIWGDMEKNIDIIKEVVAIY